jgi:phi13 family phage major tail protein
MSDFTLKRGLSNVYAAEIISDENSENGYKTGDPFHLIPAGEMSRTASSESTPVFFDNVVFYQSGSESATEISITGAALRPADIARLNAKHVDPETGAVLDTGEYKEKYFALGGETKNTDGTKELFWFMKGTFAIPEQTDKTEDDSTDTNGMTLNFSAIQTKHQFDVNGEKKPMKRVVIDTKTTKLKDDQEWTKQVVTPENLSTIVEKIATT